MNRLPRELRYTNVLEHLSERCVRANARGTLCEVFDQDGDLCIGQLRDRKDDAPEDLHVG